MGPNYSQCAVHPVRSKTLGIRWNTSINSKMFFEAKGCTPNAGNMILQENKIINPIDTVAISVKTMGAFTMLDNQIRSRAGATGPVVDAGSCSWLPGVDLLTVGNKFTVADPVAIASNVRHTNLDNSVVAARSDRYNSPYIAAHAAEGEQHGY